ncbi:peptidoglycan-binding domain-containing protein [Jannaschia pohangensis]|nr:peptidoglycan-binding domain-containing protein [Jannaschia pohangensis]
MLAATAACVPASGPAVGRADSPVNAQPGLCYALGSRISPALDLTPESPDAPPPLVRTSDLEESPEYWFETPCALRAGSRDFIEQIQRALAARDFYDGEITGIYDTATRAAVAAYQSEQGLESATLSTESAKALGLVALGRDGV